MIYTQLANQLAQHKGVEISTMMGSPCLRYKGNFMGMMFEKQAALIVKLSAPRVAELIANGHGQEFDFTGKRFKEWVLIPLEFEEKYADYLQEALEFAKSK